MQTRGGCVTECYCLYRNENGCKSCYPNQGIKEKLGEHEVEPLRSPDGKFHKAQHVKCRYPECI